LRVMLENIYCTSGAIYIYFVTLLGKNANYGRGHHIVPICAEPDNNRPLLVVAVGLGDYRWRYTHRCQFLKYEQETVFFVLLSIPYLINFNLYWRQTGNILLDSYWV